MYKIRKVKFDDHPILKNLELDFCGKDGKALDTIIFAGENGTGKSTILNALYEVASHDVKYPMTVEFESEEKIFEIRYYFNELPDGSTYIYADDHKGMNVSLLMPDIKYRYPFSGIFSDVDINFHANDISTVTSLTLDSTNDSRRSTGNLPTQINQLLIDIQSTDDSELAYAVRTSNPNKQVNDIICNERMPRFTNAFNKMFEGLTYSRIENKNGKKSILFQKNGVDIPISGLSSGEKQVVYRGCFLLRDVNATNGAFVFIDEPEISLHPNWQSKIMDYYKGIFTSEGKQTSQIFAVTHSPFVIHNDTRRDDKVIILSRDENGNIVVNDKAEYFKCNSIETVEDAFSVRLFTADQPTVYLEGRTDEMYFNKAIEVFGYKLPFVFKWIGYMDINGHEFNSGEKNLDNAYRFLVSRNLPIRNVCLKDCDTKRETESQNNVTILSIPQFENSRGMKKGIENALILDDISDADMKKFYSKKVIKGDYGEQTEAEAFNKMQFCEFICGMDNDKLTKAFTHLKETIDELQKIFE